MVDRSRFGYGLFSSIVSNALDTFLSAGIKSKVNKTTAPINANPPPIAIVAAAVKH